MAIVTAVVCKEYRVDVVNVCPAPAAERSGAQRTSSAQHCTSFARCQGYNEDAGEALC